jgi:hypothetical protein
MEKQRKEIAICPECGQHVTEKDRKQGNTKDINGKTTHKQCRLIRK